MRVKELTPVPYYFELHRTELPMTLRMADSRGRRPKDHKAEVVAYLRSDRWLVHSMSNARDAFDPTDEFGNVELTGVTDGDYYWPRGLAYYVERYDCWLAPSFERYMERRKWRRPKDLHERKFSRPEFVAPTADDLANLAVELHAHGRVEEAELAFRRVLDGAPTHERTLRMLAPMCVQQQRFQEAIDLFGRIVALAPDDAASWFQRGIAHREIARLAALRSSTDGFAAMEAAVADLRRAAALGAREAAAILRSEHRNL
jgi:tetratricopeptide (TPR) repeat protein